MDHEQRNKSERCRQDPPQHGEQTRQKKRNSRLMYADPDAFFRDLLMEQNEQQ